MERDINILIFGFSVTEEKGYVDHLKAFFQGRGVSIAHRAIGGVDIWAVPYIYELLEYQNYDIVIFEISTCLRYSERYPEAYRLVVNELVHQSRRCGCGVAFVHLFRYGVDYRYDKLNEAIDLVCNEYKVPTLNLVRDMLAADFRGELKNYLRDGTHTTALGAQFYGEKISIFIINLINDLNFSVKSNLPNTSTKCFLSTNSFFEEAGKFCRGNIELSYASLEEGESFKITIPDGYGMSGILFIKGPKTGIFEINLPGIGYYKISAFDKFSYYRRYSIWKSPVQKISSFSILQTKIIPSIQLLKGDLYLGPRVGEIVGFFCESV